MARFVVHETLHLLPWLMVAVLLGMAVEFLALDVLAKRAFQKHVLLAILLTTALGAFSPFCSFTVIPLIRRLLKVGIPLAAVMAFWMASPSMSPELFGLTAARLGVPIAAIRLVGSVVLSVTAGLIVIGLHKRGFLANPLREDRRSVCSDVSVAADDREVATVRVAPTGSVGVTTSVERREQTTVSGCGSEAVTSSCSAGPVATTSCGARAASACGGEEIDDHASWWPQAVTRLRAVRPDSFLRDLWKDTFGLGKWLVLAVVFEALILRYLPQQAVSDTLGSSGLLAIPLSAVLSIPLYVNGVGAVPIVAGLLAKGMTAGAAVTFLLGGSVTTIPALVAVRNVVSNGIVTLYFGIGVLGSILVGLIANFFL